MRTLLPAAILLVAALTGCIGGDEAPRPLGTYTVEAQDGGGGHAGHGGGGGLSHVASLDHFNGTHAEAFGHEGEELGVQMAWSLSTGSALVRLLAADGSELLNETAQGDGTLETALEVTGGELTFNVTGDDATGTLTAHAGTPASLGMSQSDPITYSDEFTVDSSSQTWTWDSKGNASLTLDVTAGTGTLTIKVLDGMANALPPVVVEAPSSENSVAMFSGAPGTWTITLQTDTYTGTLQMTLAGTS